MDAPGINPVHSKYAMQNFEYFFQEAPSGISFDCSDTGRLESTEDPLESNLESTNCDGEVERRDLGLHLEESTILSQGVQMICSFIFVSLLL